MWPELRPGRGSGAVPCEAGGGAGVEDLLVGGDVFFELGEVFYGFGVELWRGRWRGGDGRGRILWGGRLRSRRGGRRRGCRRFERRRCGASTRLVGRRRRPPVRR